MIPFTDDCKAMVSISFFLPCFMPFSQSPDRAITKGGDHVPKAVIVFFQMFLLYLFLKIYFYLFCLLFMPHDTLDLKFPDKDLNACPAPHAHIKSTRS